MNSKRIGNINLPQAASLQEVDISPLVDWLSLPLLDQRSELRQRVESLRVELGVVEAHTKLLLNKQPKVN